MKKVDANVEKLKSALDNLNRPEKLDSHSWAKSLFVGDVVANHPKLKDKAPGEQVLFAIAELFRTMMPARPPKHGVRLDARWSEFGFLAAKYFSPILFGTPVPASFQEAWGRIDQSILLFVFGKPANELTDEQIAPYILIGNEPEVTPVSTISDWHRKGLRRLMDVIATRESYLSIARPKNDEPVLTTDENVDAAELKTGSRKKNKPVILTKKQKQIRSLVFLAIIALILFLGLKAWSIYQSSLIVLDDVNQLRDKVELPPGLDDVDVAIPLLEKMREDVHNLQRDAAPVIWMAPLFKWIPNHGCDVAASGSLLKIGAGLLDVILDTYHTGEPILQAVRLGNKGLTPTDITKMFVKAQPQFADSLDTLQSIRNIRGQIDEGCLSPSLQDALVNKLDPFLTVFGDALALGIEIPRFAGASSEGPKTYLVLAQNEDELRPTGGFITAVSTILLRNGEIVSFKFENSGNLDNWSKPYPSAPWQLRQYMNSPVLILRDTNWFADYPTSALYAEQLYSYVNDHSVDGVIAFDQHVLVELLSEVGPIELDGISYPIDSSNVINYMRTEKGPSTQDLTLESLPAGASTNKEFLNALSTKLLQKIFEGDVKWESLITTVVKLLDEHHILLQIDNPSLMSFITKREWDGAVRPTAADFLMIVDSNVGFNKTNAVVDTAISYNIDLTNIKTPLSQLKISHTNHSDANIPCLQWRGYTAAGERYYPIHRCYWDYLRVYTKSGTKFVRGNPQFIPGDWMILGRNVLPKVDLLGAEIDGIEGFGVLKVVPGGRTITSEFQFALPSNVLQHESGTGSIIYQLKIQKQPGTLAVPFEVTLHVPKGASITSMPDGAVIKNGAVYITTDLRLDRVFTLVFQQK